MGRLSLGFFLVGLTLAYFLWLKPLLLARPLFSEFYSRADSFWAAVWLKFSTIKTKVMAGLLMIGSTLIELHDFILPAATGIDWTPITQGVPTWVWPIASLSVGALFLWLRHITANTEAKKIVAVEAGVVTADQAITPTAETEMAVAKMEQPATPANGAG